MLNIIKVHPDIDMLRKIIEIIQEDEFKRRKENTKEGEEKRKITIEVDLQVLLISLGLNHLIEKGMFLES